MSKYDLARIECFNRAFAASISKDGRVSYAAYVANEALNFFDKHFPKPEKDDD